MGDNDNCGSRNIVKFHPKIEELQAEVDKLRTELSMLVLERDSLLYQECKNIEMAYMLSVGALEYKAYEIKCVVLRLRRKIELMQAKKNRQEKIVISEIERILDVEFVEYQKKLNEQIGKMNAALERSNATSLTEEESSELRKLYRAIVRALHPDLHPDLNEDKIRLFHNAVRAYEQCDLDRLKMIDAMVSEHAISVQKSDGFTVLMEEKERLAKLLKIIKKKIDEIKSVFPFTMKAFVQSSEKIEVRKIELEERIKYLNEVLAEYAKRVAEMLG